MREKEVIVDELTSSLKDGCRNCDRAKKAAEYISELVVSGKAEEASIKESFPAAVNAFCTGGTAIEVSHIPSLFKTECTYPSTGLELKDEAIVADVKILEQLHM